MAINWKNDNGVTISRHNVIVKFFWCCFVSFVWFNYWSKFYINIIKGSGVMTVFFYKDWPEIRKSEILPSVFCLISEIRGEIRIPYLARMSLMKCYWLLQKAKVTAFTVSKLLRKNQQGVITLPPSPHRLVLILAKITPKQCPGAILTSKWFLNAIKKLHACEMGVQQFSSCELWLR